MRGIKVEAWRGKKGPSQCHRCQGFRHSSHGCHRQIACVRCAGPHFARDCTRPLSEPATCTNCRATHPASFRNCPVFRAEISRNAKAGRAARSAPIPSRQPNQSISGAADSGGVGPRLSDGAGQHTDTTTATTPPATTTSTIHHHQHIQKEQEEEEGTWHRTHTPNNNTSRRRTNDGASDTRLGGDRGLPGRHHASTHRSPSNTASSSLNSG